MFRCLAMSQSYLRSLLFHRKEATYFDGDHHKSIALYSNPIENHRDCRKHIDKQQALTLKGLPRNKTKGYNTASG